MAVEYVVGRATRPARRFQHEEKHRRGGGQPKATGITSQHNTISPGIAQPRCGALALVAAHIEPQDWAHDERAVAGV